MELCVNYKKQIVFSPKCPRIAFDAKFMTYPPNFVFKILNKFGCISFLISSCIRLIARHRIIAVGRNISKRRSTWYNSVLNWFSRKKIIDIHFESDGVNSSLLRMQNNDKWATTKNHKWTVVINSGICKWDMFSIQKHIWIDKCLVSSR